MDRREFTMGMLGASLISLLAAGCASPEPTTPPEAPSPATGTPTSVGKELSDAELSAIKAELRAKLAACDDAADTADVEATFAHYSDRHGLGFIYDGTDIPSVEGVKAWAGEGFGRLQSQRHDTKECRIAVLAPEVAVIVWQGDVISTAKDGSSSANVFSRTFVCVKTAGMWEFAHVHISIL